MVNIVDPVGNKTTFVYDAVNRKTQETDPLGETATFAYDAGRTALQSALQSRPDGPWRAVLRENTRCRSPHDAAGYTSTTDRIGRRRDFTFDDTSWQTGEVWYSWPSVIEDNRLTFSYAAAAGQQLTAHEGDAAYTLTYDAVGRVATRKIGTGSGRRAP